MSARYGNREPNGCGGCLALLVVFAVLAAVGGVCWKLGEALAWALVA